MPTTSPQIEITSRLLVYENRPFGRGNTFLDEKDLILAKAKKFQNLKKESLLKFVKSFRNVQLQTNGFTFDPLLKFLSQLMCQSNVILDFPLF